MKNYLKTKALTIALMLLFSVTSNGYGMYYDKIMSEVDKDFDQSEDKFGVIVRPMNPEYLSKQDEKLDFPNLYSFPKPTSRRTHALALAICACDLPRVKKYLAVVKNPNDPALLVCGRDGVHSMVSFVVKLGYFNDDSGTFWPSGDIEGRLQVIDLLADSEFDFGFHAGESYLNQALGPFSHTQEAKEIQARLWLQGAYPDYMFDGDGQDVINRAFQQAEKGKLKEIHAKEDVKRRLKKIKEERLKELQDRLKVINDLPI